MGRKLGLRGAICSAGIALGLMVPVISASAAPAAPSAGWTAVARNSSGLSFFGHGASARIAASNALYNCRHSRATAIPASCRIVSDTRS